MTVLLSFNFKKKKMMLTGAHIRDTTPLISLLSPELITCSSYLYYGDKSIRLYKLNFVTCVHRLQSNQVPKFLIVGRCERVSDSYFVNNHLCKLHSGAQMAVNISKIAHKPYLSCYYSSAKQHDYVRKIIFPENSSLQCFRTAPRFTR